MYRRTRIVLAAVTIVLGLAVSSAPPALAHRASHRGLGVEITHGTFVTLPGGRDLGYSIRGAAVMVRVGDWTAVGLHVRGLEADTTYPAHVHNGPCSATPPGGTHYQHVVGGPVDAVNEIWPAVTTNGSGAGFGFATHGHRARADARSIVIHYPPNTSIRLACLDLA